MTGIKNDKHGELPESWQDAPICARPSFGVLACRKRNGDCYDELAAELAALESEDDPSALEGTGESEQVDGAIGSGASDTGAQPEHVECPPSSSSAATFFRWMRSILR